MDGWRTLRPCASVRSLGPCVLSHSSTLMSLPSLSLATVPAPALPDLEKPINQRRSSSGSLCEPQQQESVMSIEARGLTRRGRRRSRTGRPCRRWGARWRRAGAGSSASASPCRGRGSRRCCRPGMSRSWEWGRAPGRSPAPSPARRGTGRAAICKCIICECFM
jgi:hypothetical protein